ncbi:MAG: GTP-binding protein [Candidatus Heimdallarchaeota archaeon]
MSDSDERELELLLQQLKENADIDLRCHAAQQLGLKKTKYDIVVPALIEALNDDNWLVRVEAATALGKIGQAAAVAIEPLKDAMNEPRNRPKRGIFYEVIQSLETAKSSEPEVEPIVVVEEKKEEITFEEKIKTAIAEGKSGEPIIEASEEVIEDVVEESLVEEKVEVVTDEIVEDAKTVDEVVVEDKPEEITEEAVMEEALEDAVEDVLEDAIEDIVEETVEEEVVEEIAEEIAEEVIELEPEKEEELEITEEDTVGEDITEIVEDIAEDITEDTTDKEIIEEAIEEIAEEVLEDVLEEEVGDTVDHDIIDDIAEDITEEVLETEEEEVEEPVETIQSPVIEAPEIEPEEEKKTTEDITEAIPLDEVLEFEEDKKKLAEQSPTVEPPTMEDIKTVRRSKALIKIVIVGDAAVGKTALRKKYSDTSYGQEYKHVLGADFATKHFSKNNENFSLQIWDIAAKERFDKSKELFFKSIFGALLVFDVTKRESFNNIRYWLDELRKIESKELALVIIGNKTDLRSDQESTSITREEGQELASKLSEELGFDVSYVETCAITGSGVEVAFRILEEKTTDQFFVDERKME